MDNPEPGPGCCPGSSLSPRLPDRPSVPDGAHPSGIAIACQATLREPAVLEETSTGALRHWHTQALYADTSLRNACLWSTSSLTFSTLFV